MDFSVVVEVVDYVIIHGALSKPLQYFPFNSGSKSVLMELEIQTAIQWMQTPFT